jgi:hypothetical protein
MCNNRLKCAGSLLLVSFGLMSAGVGVYEYLQYQIYLKTYIFSGVDIIP